VFLVYFLVGLLTIGMGLFSIFLAVFGRAPGRAAPAHRAAQDAAAYWKGKLATLAIGVMLLPAGCAIMAEGCAKGSRAPTPVAPPQPRSEEETKQDSALLQSTLAKGPWESIRPLADGYRIVDATFEFAEGAVKGKWEMERLRNSRNPDYSGGTVAGQLTHDGTRASVKGQFECTYRGKPASGTFAVFLTEAGRPHLVQQWSTGRTYDFDLVPSVARSATETKETTDASPAPEKKKPRGRSRAR